MDRAGSAQRHPAAELGAGQRQFVAQIPEQRHRGVVVERTLDAIDFQADHFRLARIINTTAESGNLDLKPIALICYAKLRPAAGAVPIVRAAPPENSGRRRPSHQVSNIFVRAARPKRTGFMQRRIGFVNCRPAVRLGSLGAASPFNALCPCLSPCRRRTGQSGLRSREC